ncbi:MBL fold metallo-hydrolase [Streptomyces sp. NPDC005017]|uniref:MBL fold metallo-hydrolase n=1 Tax=Streptomyces sp. NPDC005017 TaxID=3364706 RepID=UPI003674E8F2
MPADSANPVPTVAPPYTERLAPDVYAYIQPDGGWCLNNAGFVTGPGPTVLVDTAATRARARALAEAIAATGAPPPAHVVNTHHHGDHTHGNGHFTPGATVIGHLNCRREMLATGLALQRAWPGVDWGEIVVSPPSVTYTDRMVLHAAGTEIHLVHPGTPAHTTGDTVVWLPERRTVFVGDLVFNGIAPFLVEGSLDGSLRALDLLRSLDAEVVVPGHGPVCGPEAYTATEHYLRTVRRLAAAGRAAGLTVLQIARAAAREAADRDVLDHPERLVANLHRALAELDGAPAGSPLSLPRIQRDVMDFTGGAPLVCHA